MKKCMITFRSVTPAQRGEAVLKRTGISCALRRTPKWMEQQGCGYSLELACAEAMHAVEVLQAQSVPYRKVYLHNPEGRPEEMHL